MKIIILDNNSDTTAWQTTLKSLAEVVPVAITDTTIAAAITEINTLSTDLVAMSTITAKNLLQSNIPTVETPKRMHISARTHHGIQVIAITDVSYFHTDQKYVAAYHTNGMILLNDTLNALELEFADRFIRIHRQTLVARDRIKMLHKNPTGDWFIELLNCTEQLAVSRRLLPKVRKYLKQMKQHAIP